MAEEEDEAEGRVETLRLLERGSWSSCSLVPKELVWEMSWRCGGGRCDGRRRRGGRREERRRRWLSLPASLLGSVAAAASGQGRTVSWELLRRLAHRRKVLRREARGGQDEAGTAQGSRRKEAARILRLRKRLKKAMLDNDHLLQERERLEERVWYFQQELEHERQLNQVERALCQKVMYDKKNLRNEKTQTYAVDFSYESERLSKTVEELACAKEMYRKQRLLTASVCGKYVKLRESKERLRRRMSRLEEYYVRSMNTALENFDRDRIAFCQLESGSGLEKRQQQELVKRCATLSYNNAVLIFAAVQAQMRVREESPPANELSDQVTLFSILRDTKKLAEYEKRKKKEAQKESQTLEIVDNQDRFIRLAVRGNSGGRDIKEVALFEVETASEDSDTERSPRQDNPLYSCSDESGACWSRAGSSATDLGYKSGSSRAACPLSSRSASSLPLGKPCLRKPALRSESAVGVVTEPRDDPRAPDIIQASRLLSLSSTTY